jgi:pimeloyl-ACP methyl ester carboxylesterase
MVPPEYTLDAKPHSIFEDFSDGLQRANVNTLAIGKPGIDFFSSEDPYKNFYDLKMYSELTWSDLIENVKEAIKFSHGLECVDSKKISLLGHSEGTQVVTDVAKGEGSRISSLILIGFVGESFAATIDWQLYKRILEDWIVPDVDTNHDHFVSSGEASMWSEFTWFWQENDEKISFGEIESALRNNPVLNANYEKFEKSKLFKGVFRREPIYDEIAQLSHPIYVFTGELDTQTPARDAIKLRNLFLEKNKINIQVEIVKGLGHAMSVPRGFRRQKLLDATLGPVDESFKEILRKTAENLL